MKKYFSKDRGFTLIELLVVVAIIAVMSAVILTAIYGSRGKARDAKRISDIAQIQLALEQYFSKNQAYPATLSALTSGTVYISVIPTAPSPGSYEYSVKSDNLDYFIRATLENNSDALNDSLGSVPSGTYSPTIGSCAIASKYYCVGPK